MVRLMVVQGNPSLTLDQNRLMKNPETKKKNMDDVMMDLMSWLSTKGRYPGRKILA